MTNPYYGATGAPGRRTFGSSAAIRAEFEAIAAGFDKFPTPEAGKGLVGNAGGTGWDVDSRAFAVFDVAGNLGVGGAAASYGGTFHTIAVNGSAGGVFDTSLGGVRQGTFFSSSSGVVIGAHASVPLIVITGNAERMRIDESGNVGIGAAAAGGAKFQITGSFMRIGDDVFRGFIGKGSALVGGGSTTALAIRSELGPILLAYGSAELARLTEAGLMGIGRAPATKQLEVQGGIAVGFGDTEALRIPNSAGYINAFDTANTTRTGFVQWNAGGAIIHGAENSAFFRWDVQNATRMVLDVSGNLRLGLGTAGSGAATTLLLSNTSAPGTPTSGGHLWVEGGALKFKGTGGTVTTLALA